MIREFYIVFKNGLPIYNYSFYEHGKKDDILVAGVTSLINVLLEETGHEELRAIEAKDGYILYSLEGDLVFLISILERKDEIMGSFFLRQVKKTFTEMFSEELKNLDHNYVESSRFENFDKTADNIYRGLVRFSLRNPSLFKFLSADLPISLLDDIKAVGTDLVEGFPDQTIKLVRNLDSKYDVDLRSEISFSLGQFFGYELASEIRESKVGTDIDDVMKLLNEISIAEYQKGNKYVKLLLCPICRGKRSSKQSCEFFSGFIEGILNNPLITVKEISCKAMGDKNCIFSIDYQE